MNIESHGLSWMIVDYLGFSLNILDYGLWWITMEYHGLWTIMDYRGLMGLLRLVDYCGTLWMIVDYHGFLNMPRHGIAWFTRYASPSL